MEDPIQVALAEPVTSLPAGPGWWFEPKYDGHRMVMRREVGGVRCQARSGRDSTRSWPDLAAAGTALEPGTVLDGEAVVFTGGVIDFSAAQSRMASSPARAAALAHDLPASYAVFDILATARLGDVRPWPWTQRRQLLLDTLEPLGPPIQPVPATDGRDVALAWYETLRAQGIEGLVAKRGDGRYRAGRIWKKLRHSDTVDLAVVGFTGSPRRPRALVVELPDGRRAISQRLDPRTAATAAARLRPAGSGSLARSTAGDPYTPVAPGLTVEAAAGTTRHAVVTVTRVR
ncbi:DNA ligase [Streptomyces sp. NPDC088197]|uniref:ATP-dependent DNA ligase n=1 Tax=unclassified Streptomyces TaxID=2593676 RepID=UPI0036E70028